MEIPDILIAMNQIKHVFNIIWLMEVNIQLKKKTASDEVLPNKPFAIASNPKYGGCQIGVQRFTSFPMKNCTKYQS